MGDRQAARADRSVQHADARGGGVAAPAGAGSRARPTTRLLASALPPGPAECWPFGTPRRHSPIGSRPRRMALSRSARVVARAGRRVVAVRPAVAMRGLVAAAPAASVALPVGGRAMSSEPQNFSAYSIRDTANRSIVQVRSRRCPQAGRRSQEGQRAERAWRRAFTRPTRTRACAPVGRGTGPRMEPCQRGHGCAAMPGA